MQLSRDNHYVAQGYLRKWANEDSKIRTYRTLVPNENVPIWKKYHPKSIAYHRHLYSKMIETGISDEIESWFNTEFENPATSAIDKALNDQRLNNDDWNKIIRYAATQDVRTPARFIEMMHRWDRELKDTLDTALKKSVSKLSNQITQMNININDSEDNILSDDFPGKIKIIKSPENNETQIGYEVIQGRSLWLFEIRRLLSHTIRALENHKWTIVKPALNIDWLTSDDPFVKLNWYKNNNYDFKGGWGSPGTELFMPLGPKHLLYTQIGKRPMQRGTVTSIHFTNTIQKLLARHAFRYIFSIDENPLVTTWRPREVNLEKFNSEKEQWNNWHQLQSEAELSIIDEN